MIGVIAKPDQTRTVEEFFELFKTPWEIFRSGATYDVVVATSELIPEVSAKLVLIYSAGMTSADLSDHMATLETREEAVLDLLGTRMPIYGGLRIFNARRSEVCCVTTGSKAAGIRIRSGRTAIIRLGYDLFEEVRILLCTGQAVEHAAVPTLDLHIGMLRNWILEAGIGLLEIPPTPAGHNFTVCLTHDIDFVGIRRHRLDHSACGFLYRATLGALWQFVTGKLSWGRLVENWRAAAVLPFVYMGWARDFWEPFEWYLRVENGLPATYFVIPYKGCAGEKVPVSNASHRATAYDIGDIAASASRLLEQGNEIAVHGIDAWHDSGKGRAERNRISAFTGGSTQGIRMHWLLNDLRTPLALEQAGYTYDSTCGYNETVGYRAGTSHVFRPLEAHTLLELPLHIQDGALFYPKRLALSEPEAESRCRALISNARRSGGVLTVLWHDRSHAPDRLWGAFYSKLIEELKSHNPWFGTGAEVVDWFRKRRAVRFERRHASDGCGVQLCYNCEEIRPQLTLRIHRPFRPEDRLTDRQPTHIDIPWSGNAQVESIEDVFMPFGVAPTTA